jgi:hypothetical protein
MGSVALQVGETASWQLAASTCLAHCDRCSGCAFVSISLKFADCSWYRSCDLSRDELEHPKLMQHFRSGPTRRFSGGAKAQPLEQHLPHHQHGALHLRNTTAIGAHASCNISSRFTVRHGPILLQPLPPLTFNLGSNELESTIFIDRTRRGAWDRVRERALRNGGLHVVTLGMSTTAGCGASPNKCEPGLGWARYAYEAVLASLCADGNWGSISLRWSVHPKNAIGADWFAHCTSLWVPADADVVVLDVTQSVRVFGWEDVNRLSLRLRTVAPHAVLIFAHWPAVAPCGSKATQQQLAGPASRCSNPLQKNLPMSTGMANASRVAGAATIAADSLIYTSPPGVFWARNGTDHHPSPLGHELLGTIVADFISSSLRRATAALQEGAPEQTRAGGEGGDLATPPIEPVTDEVCYDNAQIMPVNKTVGFRLVDDGRDKGVAKMGWSSRRPGDRIRLGPLQLPGRGRSACGAASVRLGYLLSTDARMGNLMLSCSGCRCASKPGMLASLATGLPPMSRWPVVIKTNFEESLSEREWVDRREDQKNQSFSVSASVEFIAEFEASLYEASSTRRLTPECFVYVSHVAKPSSLRRRPGRVKPLSESRVRIDSLTLERLAFRGRQRTYETYTGQSWARTTKNCMCQ